jgi:hypothetical protein
MQSVLIKKNIIGVISDVVLKEQLYLIEKESTELQIKLASFDESNINIDDAFTVAEEYLKNPSAVWNEAELDKKLKLQWFQFPQGTTFKNEIYGTTEIACIFNVKSALLQADSTTVDIVTKSWNQIESYIFDTYRMLGQYQYV